MVTKEDGRLATPSPKPLRKKESFCASLPDVSNAGLNAGLDEEQASKSDNETSTSGLSNRKVRKHYISNFFPDSKCNGIGGVLNSVVYFDQRIPNAGRNSNFQHFFLHKS